MRSKKFAIGIFTLLGFACISGTDIETLKPNESDLVKATVRILTSCHGRQGNAVGIAGDSTGTIFRTLMSNQNLPVILMNGTSEVVDNRVTQRGPRYKLQVFTIVVSASNQFEEILREIKNSPWWNHMASFLIVNWTTEPNDGCSKAFEVLWSAWEMNVLDVNLLCGHRTKGLLIYSYNPYMTKAPSPWKLVKIYRGKNDHPWSMFVQEYRDARDVCEELDFDKTEDLGGYVIPSSAVTIDYLWHTNVNKTGIDSFEGMEGTLAQLTFRAMNASVKLLTHPSNSTLLAVNDKGESFGVMMDVENGISDIFLFSWYQEKLANLTVTYPHLTHGIGSVTQYRGNMSTLSKINAILDDSSQYGVYFIMFVTPICFKYFMRQALGVAILNTVRIVSFSCLLKLPEKTATRFYLATLFIFQITIVAIYQGKLASLLTNTVYLKNPDTIQELGHFGYTIYGHKAYGPYFNDPIIKDHFVGLDDFRCKEYVLRDPKAACVRDWDILSSDDTLIKLHVSKDAIVKMSRVFAIRKDWPLEQRYNQILSRMYEASIVQRTYTIYRRTLSSIKKFYEKMTKQQKFEVVTLDQLSFAFAILGIGLGCATVAFVLEILSA